MIAAARLDNVRHVATPEGCEIDLCIAGPITRACAWFLDFLLRLLLWFILAIVAGTVGVLGVGILLLGAFLLEWLYPIVFEARNRGQTPGKRVCGLAVVHADGRPVGWNAAFIRNTLRAVDFLPFGYATGFVASLLNADGRRLGDLAAGTVVIHVASAARTGTGGEEDGEEDSEPPPVPLTREEQRTIIEFTRRAPLLTPERAAEIAAAAGALTAGLDGDAARQRLQRIGSFLLGSSSTQARR